MLKVFLTPQTIREYRRATLGVRTKFSLRPLRFLGWLDLLQEAGISAEGFLAWFDYGMFENEGEERIGSLVDDRPSRISTRNRQMMYLERCEPEQDEKIMLIDLSDKLWLRYRGSRECRILVPPSTGVLGFGGSGFYVVRAETPDAWIRFSIGNDQDEVFALSDNRSQLVPEGVNELRFDNDFEERIRECGWRHADEEKSAALKAERLAEVEKMVADFDVERVELDARDEAYFYLVEGASCRRYLYLSDGGEEKETNFPGIDRAKEYLLAMREAQDRARKEARRVELDREREETREILAQLREEYDDRYMERRAAAVKLGLPQDVAGARRPYAARPEYIWVVEPDGDFREPDASFNPRGSWRKGVEEADKVVWRQILEGEMVVKLNFTEDALRLDAKVYGENATPTKEQEDQLKKLQQFVCEL